MAKNGVFFGDKNFWSLENEGYKIKFTIYLSLVFAFATTLPLYLSKKVKNVSEEGSESKAQPFSQKRCRDKNFGVFLLFWYIWPEIS